MESNLEMQKINENEFYKLINETVNDGIWVTDKNDILIFINKGVERITGINCDNRIGSNVLLDFANEDNSEFKDYYLKAKNSLKPIFYETKIRTPEGRDIFQQGWLSPLIKNGEFDGIICTIHDVTKQKDIEEEIIKAKEISEKYLNLAGTIILALNADGYITLLNKKGYEILGYDEGELIGKNWFDNCIQAIDVNEIKEVFSKIMNGEIESVNYYENLVRRKDGQVRIIKWHNTILKDDDGNIIGTLSSGEDITDKIELEQKLQRIFDMSSDLICEADINTTKFTKINPAFISTLGYSEEELLSHSFIDFIHPNDKSDTLRIVEEELRKGKNVISFRNRYRCKDGSYVWLDWNSHPVAELGFTYAIARNITEQIRTINALQDSEERFYNIFENRANAVCVFDDDGIISLCNTKFAEMTGYQKQEIENIKKWFDFVSKSDFERLKEIHEQRSSNENAPSNYYFNLIDKNGEIKTVMVNIGLLHKKKERIANITDITEEKIQQEELKRRTIELEKSREEYKDLINGMNDTAWVIDFNGIFIETNDACTKKLGYSKEELLSMGPKDIDPTIKPEDIQKLIDSIKEDKIQVFETNHRTKDGKNIPVEISSSLVQYHGKTVILSIARDITERKKDEEKIKESEKFLNDVFNSISDGISVLDKELHIIQTNQFMVKMYQHNLPFAGKKCYEVYQNRTSPCNGCPSLKAIETKKPQSCIVPFPDEKNPSGWIDLSSYPLIDDNGAIKGVIEYVKDITEKKKGELELAYAHELLENINRDLEKKVEERTAEVVKLLHQKDDFINQLGHDLKNPLGPLVNIIPIIEKNECNPEIKEMLEVVNRNVHYMKNLVIKTIELAQLNSPNTAFNMTRIDLSGVIKEIVDINRMLFQNNNVEVFNNISDGIIVDADQLRIEELLINLLNNAVKYSNDAGKIVIDANVSDDLVTVSIKDNGIGMSEEQIAHVFDEFYKADRSRHDFESSGLGMPICKRIIEKHGGKIWVDSEGIGRGTTIYFSLRLPVIGKEKPKTSERISTIEFNGKEILYLDYSFVNEFNDDSLQEIVDFITNYGKRDLLVLTNVQGNYFNRESMKISKKVFSILKPYIKKHAIYGIKKSQDIFLKAIKLFSEFDMKSFDDIEKAKEWLIE